MHEQLRGEIYKEILNLAPEGVDVAFVPEGFKSAAWNPDTCMRMAEELVKNKDIDLVITFGPWTVEDLFKAGFTRPIVATYRYDPQLEGLVDERGRPVADNLTVRLDPGKTARELAEVKSLFHPDKLGVLVFHTADEAEKINGRLSQIGDSLGMEILTADGYDRENTYAYFKGLDDLMDSVDAFYLGPLWGITGSRIEWIFVTTGRKDKPVFVWDGSTIVRRGAVAGTAGDDIAALARYHADKVIKIMQGAIPADLPVVFPRQTKLIINEASAINHGWELPVDTFNRFEIIPNPTPPEDFSYTLSNAWAQAFSLNPGYLAGEEAVNSSHLSVSRAKSDYLPKVYAKGILGYTDQTIPYNTDWGILSDEFAGSINLEQTLFSLPTLNEIKKAVHEKNIREIDFRDKQLQLELAVTLAYLKILECEENLEAYNSERKAVAYCLNITRADDFFTEYDDMAPVRWRDELAGVDNKIIAARKNLELAKSLFNLLMSLPAKTPFSIDSSVFSMAQLEKEYYSFSMAIAKLGGEPDFEDVLVAQALDTRPELQKNEEAQNLKRLELSGSKAQFWPQARLRGAYNYHNRLFELAPDIFGDEDSWFLGAEFTWSLFEGGRRIRDKQIYRSELSGLEYERDEIRINIISEVRTRANAMTGAMYQLPGSAHSSELAANYVLRSLDEYAAGRMILAEMVDAIENTSQARLAYIENRYKYFENVAFLVNRIGWDCYADGVSPSEQLMLKLSGYMD